MYLTWCLTLTLELCSVTLLDQLRLIVIYWNRYTELERAVQWYWIGTDLILKIIKIWSTDKTLLYYIARKSDWFITKSCSVLTMFRILSCEKFYFTEKYKEKNQWVSLINDDIHNVNLQFISFRLFIIFCFVFLQIIIKLPVYCI